eukprot:SAG31_NODE_4881_length_2884_cov_96.968425_4_plen_102_part_01
MRRVQRYLSVRAGWLYGRAVPCVRLRSRVAGRARGRRANPWLGSAVNRIMDGKGKGKGARGGVGKGSPGPPPPPPPHTTTASACGGEVDAAAEMAAVRAALS